MPFLPFAVAAVTKAAMFTLCESIHVEGLEHLIAALQSGKGVLTSPLNVVRDPLSRSDAVSIDGYLYRVAYAVSNHISVIDDPVALSVAMPLRYFLSSSTTRWTLGASDICFKNPPQSFFFKRGQVIETFRSSAAPEKAGIYQFAIDESIRKLDKGQWLHVFPEAKVHQHPQKELIRFRWGASRVLMETKNDYEVLPIWLEGFDDLMPLERDFPRFIPRFFGARIRIIIGPSITSRIRPLVEAYREKAGGAYPLVKGPFDEQARVRPRPPKYEGDSQEAIETRIKIAAVMKEEVEKLGRRRAHLQEVEA